MMRKTHIASSGFTAVQVGRVVPADESADGGTVEAPTPARRRGGGVRNVRAGNARVGLQAGIVAGDIEVHL
ncbi:hypothetical protein ACWEPC_38345 [Nonomuraea sp. NPDC004297]